MYLETGAGKTLIAALLAKDFIQDKGGKVIIMLVCPDNAVITRAVPGLLD